METGQKTAWNVHGVREDIAIEIVEVIRRTQQGVTQPYICRSEDGELYFVKGRGAGYASLAKEWVAGCLAKRLGCPYPISKF